MCVCVLQTISCVCVYIYMYMYRVLLQKTLALLFTATHCKRLQHTATHCNRLFLQKKLALFFKRKNSLVTGRIANTFRCVCVYCKQFHVCVCIYIYVYIYIYTCRGLFCRRDNNNSCYRVSKNHILS